MANMTLPTEAEVRAIDTSGFTWDDLLDGLLTTGQASVIKAVGDKMESGEIMTILHFHVPNVNNAFWATFNAMTATGKLWSVEYVLNTETDNSGPWQAAIVKKA